jgi:F-type H+-transporting ATPase subunit epsilon
MKLDIISPEKTIYSGDVELITLPGELGRFTILEKHAPLISSLIQGELLYRNKGTDVRLMITGGFVEVKNDTISVCIDSIANIQK